MRNVRNTRRSKADRAILKKAFSDIGDIWNEIENIYVALGNVCENMDKAYEELGDYYFDW